MKLKMFQTPELGVKYCVSIDGGSLTIVVVHKVTRKNVTMDIFTNIGIVRDCFTLSRCASWDWAEAEQPRALRNSAFA